MSLVSPEILALLPWAAPPLIGAFIGYLTNRVAIRMLFRPLKKWYVGPFHLPMTPGVIPSKRYELAENIGEMVGEHLLTSSEIGNGLQKRAFQDHLSRLLEEKLASFMQRDLGPLPSLIPSPYLPYVAGARKAIAFQIKEMVHSFLFSQRGEQTIRDMTARSVQEIMDAPIGDLVPSEVRERVYGSVESALRSFAESAAFSENLKGFVIEKTTAAVDREASVDDILPKALVDMITETIAAQAPFLVDRTIQLTREPAVQDRIIDAVKNAIEAFIENFGPMAAMIQGFLDMDMVEEKIRTYLDRDENDFTRLLSEERVQQKVEQFLRARAVALMQTDIKKLGASLDPTAISSFCDQLSTTLLLLLNDPETISRLTLLIKSGLEEELDDGKKTVGAVITHLAGTEKGTGISELIADKTLVAMRSGNSRQSLDTLVDTIIDDLLQKPIGPLMNQVPEGVRKGLCRSTQQLLTTILVSEVPGVVKSLGIRKIVTDRINSFDLLRLERLLLSIMEEQFKYINLFGALLGFLIGCVNSALLFIG